VVSPERVSYQFVLAKYTLFLIPHSFIPLPKSATPSRIRSNASVYDFELSDEDMGALNALDRGKDGAVSWNPVDAE